ncbi:MAG TPA: RDD family protein [Arenimonas sp.]|nr:RDD family protein [Arenimonas sp.]
MNAPAGFWRRYAAYSADLALLMLLWLPLAWPSLLRANAQLRSDLLVVQQRVLDLMEVALRSLQSPFTLLGQWSQDALLRSSLESLLANLTLATLQLAALLVGLAAAYFIAFEASPWQASPGKRGMGLCVLSATGTRPTLPQLVLRFASGGLSWLTLNLGHALAAWTPNKTALHDWLSGTRVQRDGARRWPTWAVLWLVLQALCAIALLLWLGWRYWLALQLITGVVA